MGEMRELGPEGAWRAHREACVVSADLDQEPKSGLGRLETRYHFTQCRWQQLGCAKPGAVVFLGHWVCTRVSVLTLWPHRHRGYVGAVAASPAPAVFASGQA